VRDFGPPNRTHSVGRQRDHGGRLSAERDELDLERGGSGIDMNHRADVAWLKPALGNSTGQNHPVMFSNHLSHYIPWDTR
jgi:hypothetical protein